MQVLSKEAYAHLLTKAMAFQLISLWCCLAEKMQQT